MLERMWRSRNTFTLLVECKLVQPLRKTVWWFLKDLEIELPFDSAIPLLAIYPKDYKSFYYKDTCTCMFIVAPFVPGKDLEPTQMPINDRLDKANVAHLHHGILCSHKKLWVYVLCRNIDESRNHYSQQNDTRTENQTPRVLIHKWVLNNENTDTGRGTSHTGACQEGGGNRGGVRVLGTYNIRRNT